MKRSYLPLVVLGLAVLLLAGFSLGYYLHMSTALQAFARETDRTSADYDFSLLWIPPPGGGWARPTVLARPREGPQASLAARTRWRWSVPNPAEPCDADEHRLVWRAGKNAWELVEDLEQDLSQPLFPEREEGR